MISQDVSVEVYYQLIIIAIILRYVRVEVKVVIIKTTFLRASYGRVFKIRIIYSEYKHIWKN